MSQRMLQRMLRSNQVVPSPSKGPGDSDVSDVEESHEQGLVRNRFDLLGVQDESEEIEEGDLHSSEVTASRATSVPSKAKKKKNKGKKKGKQEIGNVKATDDDLVDLLTERLSISNGEQSSTSASGIQQAKTPSQTGHELPCILAADAKHLRAEDELRRIFGSKVINAVEKRGDMSGSVRRRQGGFRGRSLPFKKSLLVVPSEHWPHWDGGMSMECTGGKDGLQFFRYTFSESYMEVQRKFEACVASHDHNTVAMLLGQHPYHVESLLALADVYKHMGEHQQSANLLERCLYALECAWHPCFYPPLGTCRMDFSFDENKPFFMALFRHMQHLGRRGCHRTALEVCKLLLSLDANDPLGSLFCIDYYALRAEQYKWLEQFVEHYPNDTALSLLPNFCLSSAVARYYLEKQGLEQTWRKGENTSEERVSLVNEVQSGDLLRQALMLHPYVLKRIIEKASVKGDTVWEKISSHPHFSKAKAGGVTLKHLINIYVERNYLIWRVPELQSWLKEVALGFTQVMDKSLDSSHSLEIANWACVRREAFQSNHNEYKHLHVSEFSDNMSTIPLDGMPQFVPHLDGMGPGGPPHFLGLQYI